MVWRARLGVALAAAIVAASCGSGDDGASGRPAPESSSARTSEQPQRGVRLARVGVFSAPTFVTAPPGDDRRLLVVEQAGRIVLVRDGERRDEPFLDIRDQVTSGGEQGLLGLAFAPDYASSGRFYAYFTDKRQDQRLVEYRRRDADRADPGSARVVLALPDSEANHNGGMLQFGPDGLLYVGTGDGGGSGDRHGARGNAQDLGSLLGKILRIDPRAAAAGRPYSVPRENPFVRRTGARGEVFAYGLRNPWRFSFDRATGDLAIGDVGQSAFEEISFVRRGRARGANFGWRPFEGRARYAPGESAPGHVRPVIVRSHAAGNCSITGGVVVRDDGLTGLRGRYVFGDFCRGRIESARLRADGAHDVRGGSLRVAMLSSFGEDARGRVYAASLAGPVYRLAPR